MIMKNIFYVSILFSIAIVVFSCNSKAEELPETNTEISTSANSWVYENPKLSEKVITENGIQNWENNLKIRTYFKVEDIGEINIGFRGRVLDGKSVLKLTFNGVSKTITISNNIIEDHFVGVFKVEEPGYVFVELEGIEKTGNYFAEIESILIGGSVTKGKVYFIKDDIYWGRRGPSVHLNYEIPKESKEILYFYNEMTIPKGKDVIGSYFMANGFGEGYFGIQVNSETERRILFSVWSPYKTDDPSAIPEDQKIILLAKGESVITGEFGNEGSGGQSRKVFNWKADATYKFLLKGAPAENNSTDFTAYFFAPENGTWELIASFRRPKTNTFLTRPHSFLENFITSTGNKSRSVNYTNQWVYDTAGNWFEIVNARFTADATARRDSRLDFNGGDETTSFYLRNCGFFNTTTAIGSEFSRTKNGIAPEIDFNSLPR